MSKITLEVNEKNLETVLLMLGNFKEGLIDNIVTDKKSTKRASTYQPRENKIVKEGQLIRGKYLDKDSYKKRLAKR